MTALSENLQPLSMAQLLDRAIRLYRSNFLIFVGIVALAQIPATAVNMVGLWLAPTPQFGFDPTASVFDVWLQVAESSGFGNNPWVWLGRLVTLLLVQLATAAMTKAVAENYLGHKIGLFEAYQKIGRSGITLLIATFLGIFLMIALAVWALVPCVGWISGLGMIFFFALVILPLVAPIIVLEHRSAGQAIQRAWDLARRRIWWLIGFMLLLGLFGQLVVTGPAILSVVLVESAVGSGVNATTSSLIQQVIVLLLNLIYLPLQLTCVTLLYFDIRVRTEGFDLAVLALSDRVDSETVRVTAPPLEKNVLPRLEEVGYFSLITVAIVVLYIALFLVFLVAALGFSGF
ncbi:MAG: glycerophosphoryl diester phosphodiesterase membrane domain-containing protein [Anaerolineaceae bacterium]|nr:glycerophosphoryl diester phosphodiesterase membrane domain-containing protein [Anaerolineaceae bacterium]